MLEHMSLVVSAALTTSCASSISSTSRWLASLPGTSCTTTCKSACNTDALSAINDRPALFAKIAQTTGQSLSSVNCSESGSATPAGPGFFGTASPALCHFAAPQGVVTCDSAVPTFRRLCCCAASCV
eukprot:m.60074 g.60074  ORF g.60074 m.60074 type:complete len:127 (+) comp49310_c0_seq1:247-627(+)